jgi:serine/threonine-protein kinase RIO1
VQSSMGAEHAPSGEIEKVRADVERLEKARDEYADSGIRKLIEAWIEQQKQWLASAKNPNLPAPRPRCFGSYR